MQDELTKIEGYLAEAWQALETQGATIPAEKNTANLAEAIRTIEIVEEEWDPKKPTLGGFKTACKNGVDVAVSTEIPDEHGGDNAPLIVAQKLTSSNNSSYGGVKGYILVRKYTVGANKTVVYGDTADFSTSNIKNYLDTEYLDACSSTLKRILGEISVPCYGGGSVLSKWFVMSGPEVMGLNITNQGFGWDYWKKKTGLSSPSQTANSGRVVTDKDGKAPVRIWLRSPLNGNSGTSVYVVNSDGYISNYNTSGVFSVLPACFVPANFS